MQKKANKSGKERSGSTEAKIFLSIFTVAKVRGADHGRNEKWVSAHAEAAEERGGLGKGHHAVAAEERGVWEKGITQRPRRNAEEEFRIVDLFGRRSVSVARG
jgi:hypothetical protein